MTVALAGPFGLGNLGDAAIQDTVIEQLRTRRPDIRLVGISMRPVDTQCRHGLATFAYDAQAFGESLERPVLDQDLDAGWAKRLRRRVVEGLEWRLRPYRTWCLQLLHPWYAWKVVRGIDVLLMSGGGQLDDYWDGPWNQPFSLFKWSMLARLQGKRLAYLSVGVGSVDHTASRHMLRWALAAADYRSYRDEGSAALVQEAIGIDAKEGIVPDMAFALSAQLRPVGYPAAASSDDRLTVAIGPLPYFHPRLWPQSDEARYQSYIRLMVDCCTAFLRRGLRLIFIVGQTRHDPIVVQDISSQLPDARDPTGRTLVEAPSIQNVGDLLAEISRSDIVISSRFHGVLLSLIQHKPVLALSYERKVAQLMKDLRQEAFTLELDDSKAESVVHVMEELVARRSEIAAGLSKVVPKATRRVLEQFDFVATQLIPQGNAPAPEAAR